MASNDNPSQAGQDLRRDRRFEVSQPALVTHPGQKDIACEIRDFCLGGMFLRFTNPEAAIAALARHEGADVEIVFTPPGPDARRTFRVSATLRRLSPLGVGVAFSRPPVEALRALQKLRMASHRQRIDSAPATVVAQRLRETCKTLLQETLVQSQALMTRLLDERLASAALHAPGIAEHSGLLDAQTHFRNEAANIQAAFVRSVEEAFVHPTPPAATPLASDSLALVDELDFEDWLATSAEATKLEEQFAVELADIEPRVAELFARPFDHTSNPFGPSVICHAYRRAIADLPILGRARTVAYACLREVLGGELAPLYAELLALLPVSEREMGEPAPSPASYAGGEEAGGPQSGDTGGPTAGGAALAGNGVGGQAGARQGSLGRLANSLMDFFRGSGVPSAVPDLRQPGMAMPPHGVAPQGVAPQGMAPQGMASAPPPPGATAPAGGAVAQGAVPSQVLQRLSAAGALPQNLSQEMRRSVDLFGALFDTMHAEKSISEGMRPFFGQLEASLIKLAISDPSFLSSPHHPAHRVLNTLDRISMMAGEDGKITDERLLRLMRRWTDRINSEAEKNPGVFEEASTQLERVVRPLLGDRAARIARLQEICEGRQRAESAKRSVLTRLLARMGEKPVPTVVIELINGGWRNVLLMTGLRHGEDSPEAAAAWNALDQLSEWLDQARSGDLPVNDVRLLLRYIDTMLTHVAADKFAQDRLLDQLAATLFDEDKSRYEYTTVSARLKDIPAETLTPGQSTLVERLRVGDWLQFSDLDSPLNLVWMGDKPPVYVFANYRGIKKLDIKRQDLLQRLETNTAQWTADMDLPLMDRSYSAMIQKMQRDLLWQSSHDPATGLLNRRAFFRAMRRNWLRSPSGTPGFAVGIIQAEILDREGNKAAVDVRVPFLRDFAGLVQSQFPADALLARAGEQAIAFWRKSPDAPAAQAEAQRLREKLDGHQQTIDGRTFRAKVHIGLRWAPDCLEPERYYDDANAASAAARDSAAGGVVLFDADTTGRDVDSLARWAHELTRMLAEDRLDLAIQPIVDATAGGVIFHEVLLRAHADGGGETLDTAELIAVAERLARITEIDRWVARRVFEWMRSHPGRVASSAGLAINLSGQSLVNPLFLNFLLGELGRGDLRGDKIIFQVAELDAVEGHSQTAHFVRQLQRFGCRFVLGEFGLGNSSYTTLKGLRLDFLKIDRSLVRELSSSLIDEALVRAIVETASFLGIGAIAGFVENRETLEKLKDLGVPYVQGEFIAPPVPIAVLLETDLPQGPAAVP